MGKANARLVALMTSVLRSSRQKQRDEKKSVKHWKPTHGLPRMPLRMPDFLKVGKKGLSPGMPFSDWIKYIMLAFLLLGGLDHCLGNRFGLGEGFREGFMTMGSLALAMIGMNTVAPLLADALSGALVPLFRAIGADPSMFAGAILPNDSGGYALAMSLCGDARVGGYAGAVVASMMGVTFTFTIPFAFSTVKEAETRRCLSRGLLIGIVTLPAGCVAGGLLSGLYGARLLLNLLPMLCMAAALFLCLLLFPEGSVRVMGAFGRLLSVFIILALMLAVVDHQTGAALFGGRLTPFSESLAIIGNIAVVLAGAFPLLKLLQKLLKGPLARLGARMGVNETSVTGLFTTLINSIPTFGFMEKMDSRGKVLNAAFAVSAAFALGDHLGFTAGVCPEYLLPMIAGKLAGGFCALLLALYLTRNDSRVPNNAMEV